MNHVIFIYGPPASGKSRYSKQLAEFYGCHKIIHEWKYTKTQAIVPGTLVLTTEPLDGAIHINDALKTAKVTQ